MTLSRRAFLTAASTGAMALGADAFALEPGHVEVTRHDVRVPGLPPALDGLTLAQVTDTHLPGNQAAATRALELLRRERPDIVVLSGDIVEWRHGLGVLRDFASDARGRLATVALPGNHEYARGIPMGELEQAYGRAGVEMLRNARALVPVRGATVELLGFDDYVESSPDARFASRDVPDADLRIWSVHEPGFVLELPPALSAAPAVLLAGHTHGGQVRLPGVPALLPARSAGFVAGWYLGLPAPLYVSRGVGTSGVRVRFLCPAELPIFTFRRA